MSISFPSSPSLNQTFSSNNYTWQWDGVSWNSLGGVANTTIMINTDEFVANGTGTTFVLSTTPISSNSIVVNINGVTQQKSVYSVAGNTITFSSTPFNGANVEVSYNYNSVSGIFVSNFNNSFPSGTYGSSTSIPTISVNEYGQISAITTNPIVVPPGTSIVANTGQLTANSSTGIVALGLSPVGVAGVYGNTTSIPTITVDTYGRVTSVSNNTISTGGGPILFASNTITSDTIFASNNNGLSIGPININNGVTVTVNNGQRWVII
jgi:hypothetical protein